MRRHLLALALISGSGLFMSCDHPDPKAGARLGTGRDALSSFTFTQVDSFSYEWGDKYIDVDGAYGAQCWDLWEQYCRELVGTSNISTQYGPHPGYVSNIWDGYSQDGAAPYFTQVSASATAQKGDVAIWQYGSAVAPSSHIAIVLEDNGAYLKILSQNSSPSRPDNPYPGLSTGPTVTMSMTKTGLAGYLRPIGITGNNVQGEGRQMMGGIWQEHTWFRQSNSALRHWWWDGSTNTINAETWATNAVGQPATLRYGVERHAFYRGSTNNLEHRWWSSQGTGIYADTWLSNIASDPAAIIYNGEQHAMAVDTSGNLQHAWWSPVTNLKYNDTWVTGGVAGRPSLVFFDGEQHAYVRTTGNQIMHVKWTSATGIVNEVLANSANIVGDPVGARVNDSENHVWAVDSSGNLRHWWNGGGGWSTDTWTTGVTGRPTFVYIYEQKRQQIYVRGTDGSLVSASWDPVSGMIVQNWGTPLASDPSTLRINGNVHIHGLDSGDVDQHWWFLPGNNYLRNNWGT